MVDAKQRQRVREDVSWLWRDEREQQQQYQRTRATEGTRDEGTDKVQTGWGRRSLIKTLIRLLDEKVLFLYLSFIHFIHLLALGTSFFFKSFNP